MKTNIMGTAVATVQQMQSYIQKVNPAVPKSVIDMVEYYDVGVKTINKFNPIPYSTLKNSYFVVYRRGLGNI